MWLARKWIISNWGVHCLQLGSYAEHLIRRLLDSSIIDHKLNIYSGVSIKDGRDFETDLGSCCNIETVYR
jgi:hypothetical protein